MGLFAQLPEEPSEWAGLPSEPDRPETDAERLTAAGAAGLPLVGISAATGVTSVDITFELEPESDESAAS